MDKKANLSRRFVELVDQLDALAKTKKYHAGELNSGSYIDNNLFINWKLKARNLLSIACGQQSIHFADFVEREKGEYRSTNYQDMAVLKAVFEAAKEDFEGGYCNSLRTLIQSEVFDNELDQARALLEGGYLSAAAVIAGVVLETTLRQLCDNCSISHGKLDKMNADLAKLGQYNILKQKQITSWADIRNNAAHGYPEKFTRDDVKDMISKIEEFVADHL